MLGHSWPSFVARSILGLTTWILCTFASAAAGQNGSVERGRGILDSNCARCHSIEKTGDSPFGLAPPFRTLYQRYPLEDLEESLAEGILSGHPAMPEFRFSPEQIADIIAYLKSISH